MPNFSLTPRNQVLLLLAPAVLLVCILFGHRAWQSLGGGVPKYTTVDLKSLGNFTFDSEGGRTLDIPAQWRELDGRRVSMSGYLINPQPPGPGLQWYCLVYQLNWPELRGPPLIQERVYANLAASSHSVSAYDLVHVYGVLHVSVQRDQFGTIRSIFRMDVESASVLDDPPNVRRPNAEIWVAMLISYLLLVAVVLAKHWPWRDLSGRRAAAGLCPSCGYDLRASRGRCPECGERVKAHVDSAKVREAASFSPSDEPCTSPESP
jgi:hypothetical protein